MRTTLTPLPQPVLAWFSSKSISVVPLGSCTRVQNRFRKPGPPASGSTYAPKLSRSLLLLGMLPVVVPGQGSSSLEPPE